MTGARAEPFALQEARPLGVAQLAARPEHALDLPHQLHPELLLHLPRASPDGVHSQATAEQDVGENLVPDDDGPVRSMSP